MKKITLFLLISLLLLTVLLTLWSCGEKTPDTEAAEKTLWSSITDIETDGSVIYLTDAGQNRICRLENGEVKEKDMPASPAALALDVQNRRLYAAGGNAEGWIALYDADTLEIIAQTAAGHTPVDLIFAGDSLFVAERFDNAIRQLNPETLETVNVTGTVREPAALTIAGDCLYCAALLPEGSALAEKVAVEVGVYRTSDLGEVTRIALTSGSTGARGIAAAPDGSAVFVTHTLGRYNVATTQLDRGWVYTNAVSVIDPKKQELMGTVLLDDIDCGAANPWGAACIGDKLAVGIAGTGELITLNAETLVKELRRSDNPDKIADTLDFAYRYKTRTDLGDAGIRAVAAGNGEFIAANYFTGKVFAVSAEDCSVRELYDFSTGEADTEERAGERLWNDASLCYQEWLTCASCHPDARTDAMNWDNLNDGIGTPKQARTMLGTFERGRVMATGIRENADVAIAAGIRYICFNGGDTRKEQAQIAAYLKSLEPVPSPYLVDGQLSEAALRGKELFEGKAECASCHANAVYGNDILIENHTQTGNESRGLLVPPLIEVWRTAPYLYDGRAATIQAVLTEFNPVGEDGRTVHGNTAELTEDEIHDLTEYVLSLPEQKNG